MLTNRASYPIEAVILKHEPDDVLLATVVLSVREAGEVAFYLFRNEERIHIKWYSPDTTLRFIVKARSGFYRVLAFFRSPDGTIINKYSNPVFLYPVVYALEQTFKKPQSQERVLVLSGSHWKFPALYYAGHEQQPLFVILSGRVDRAKHSLPSFSRWAWAEQRMFPGHVLCVADPTLELHEGLELGWYLGTAEHDASEELADLLRRFAERLGIPEGKIIFWGSSGGGFSALALASRMENTTAVAINAQTNILVYDVAQATENIRRHCFGGKSIREIQSRFGPRVNVIQAWNNNRRSRAILLQNTCDTHHYAHHFKPFWEVHGGASEEGAAANGRHFAWIYSDTRGHVRESEQMIPGILNLIS